MRQNILDNNFTDKSVCRRCKYKHDDKNECLDFCERLKAYQQGKPYSHIPQYEKSILYYEGVSEVEIMEQKESDTIPAPIESKEMDEYQKKYTDETFKEIINRIKKQPVEQVTKTWQEKYEYCSAATECLHCGKPKSKTNKLQAGLCKRICNARWRRNSILHPLYGEFLSQEQIKMNWSAEKAKKIVAKKTLNHGISDEALRNVQPNLEAAVKRIDARYNPEELHTAKEILDETAARIITIDLVKYEVLYNKSQALAKSQFTTIEHTLINLISLGIQVVERNTKQSF